MNHYYLYNLLADNPNLPVRNHWFRDGDPGNLVLAAGVGIVASTEKAPRRSASSTSCSPSGPALHRARPRRGRVPAHRRRPPAARPPSAHVDQGAEVHPRATLGRPHAGGAAAPRGGLHQVTSAGAAPRLARPPRAAVARAAAALVALARVLPVAYLLLRALSADASARALAPLSTTLELAVGHGAARLRRRRRDAPRRRAAGVARRPHGSSRRRALGRRRIPSARDPQLRRGARPARRVRAARARSRKRSSRSASSGFPR